MLRLTIINLTQNHPAPLLPILVSAFSSPSLSFYIWKAKTKLQLNPGPHQFECFITCQQLQALDGLCARLWIYWFGFKPCVRSNDHNTFLVRSYKYLLLTKFEVRTISYGPSFFPFDLWPKREARAINHRGKNKGLSLTVRTEKTRLVRY